MKEGIGEIFMKWEHRQLAGIAETRVEIEEIRELVLPVWRSLERAGVEVEDCSFGWWSSLTLGKGKRLPEKVYKEVSERFGQFPELQVGDPGSFTWSVNGEGVRWLQIKLGPGACQIRKVVTTEEVCREEERVRYELVGECSGLEV